MEDKLKRLAVLMAGHRSHELTDDQSAELLAWVGLSPANRELFDKCCDPNRTLQDLEIIKMGIARQEQIWQRIVVKQGTRKQQEPTKIILWRWRITVAAAALFFCLVTTYLLYYKPVNKAPITPVTVASNDVLPGGSKAILTLDNGTEIALNDQKDGQLADQGDAIIIKKGNQINYINDGRAKEDKPYYNTVRTPITGEYKMILEDGTEVWLNSISSIRYPSAFGKGSRNVEITGEAYFKVAKDPSRPFIISILSTDGSSTHNQVQVLGTEFNVMAYGDEGMINTTLIEGSVRMSNELNSVLIKPGQQVVSTSINGLKVISNVDVDKETAWVKGLFKFDNTDLKTVMRQLARWYDIEVVYDKGFPEHLLFNGEVPKTVNISAVLKVLEFMGARFKIEGKVVRVLAN